MQTAALAVLRETARLLAVELADAGCYSITASIPATI